MRLPNKPIHSADELAKIGVVHDRRQAGKFGAGFLPIALEAARVAALPMDKRGGGLDDAFVEGRIWLIGNSPTCFPMLVCMPKPATVEEFNALMIVLSAFRIQD